MLKDRLRTKSNKKPSRKRIILITSLIALLIIGGGLFIWFKSKSDNSSKNNDTSDIRPQNTVDYSPADADDNKDIEESKGNPSKDPTTVDNRTTNPSGNVDFSVTVTGANPDNTNKLARVSTLVNGATNGTCIVTFSKAGQPNITATNQVELQNNSYVCPNFTVPFANFPAGGEWNVSVSVTSNGKTVTSQWQGGPITINK